MKIIEVQGTKAQAQLEVDVGSYLLPRDSPCSSPACQEQTWAGLNSNSLAMPVKENQNSNRKQQRAANVGPSVMSDLCSFAPV